MHMKFGSVQNALNFYVRRFWLFHQIRKKMC